jgi:hypothetical protein
MPLRYLDESKITSSKKKQSSSTKTRTKNIMTATLELMPNVGDWVLLKKMVRENKLSALYEGSFHANSTRP